MPAISEARRRAVTILPWPQGEPFRASMTRIATSRQIPPPLGLSQRGAAPRQPVRRAHSRHRWACPSGALLLASPCAVPIPATAGLVPAGRCSSPDAAVCWRGAMLDGDMPCRGVLALWRRLWREMEPFGETLKRLPCGKKLQVASYQGLALRPQLKLFRPFGSGVNDWQRLAQRRVAKSCVSTAVRTSGGNR